jgi:hypothetical protein
MTSPSEPLNIGIPIIGSLYWDDTCARTEWRKRLNLLEEFAVPAPIRYGRQSESRNCTYTMVFSHACDEEGKLGQAKAIRCKHNPSSFDELLLEAQWLWAAEQDELKPSGVVSASWGCVGLIPLEGGAVPPDWIEKWRDFVLGKRGYGTLSHSPEDVRPAVDGGGLFSLRYKKSDALPLDLLLATATKPSLIGEAARYATPQEVAFEWNKHKVESKYYWCNRHCGIHTFEDQAIEKHLTGRPVDLPCTKK